MLELVPPEETIALVVGIDHYGYGERWTLAGPGADALRCSKWLIGRGVSPGNIALFLSTPSIKGDPDVAAWTASHPTCVPRPATRGNLLEFVDKELPLKKEMHALIVFWGGHGVADDFEDVNYLYTEDAAASLPLCISVQDLSAALRGKRFRFLADQVLIIDACANPYSDTRESALPGWTQFIKQGIDRDIRQVQMFSATRGRTAANVSERRSGLFSGTLLTELERHSSPGWPDLIKAFNTTISGVEKLGLAEQQPYLVLLDANGGQLRYSGIAPRDGSGTADLLQLVRQTSASPALLHRLYLNALPDRSRAKPQSASLEQWLRDLGDSRSADPKLPPPLVQFAERLARLLSDSAIVGWVDEHTQRDINARNALRALLDAEARSRRGRATLFIEVSERQDEIHWWVHAPQPQDCSRRESETIDIPVKAALASRLADIAEMAEGQLRGQNDLVVSLIVPDTLLLAELESLKVDFDKNGRLVALNRRYPVTLHWRTRVLACEDERSRPVNVWRKALDALRPRLAKGGGADVLWLRDAVADDDDDDPIAEAWVTLTEAAGTSICVGLGHAGAAAAGVSTHIRGCLIEGVPCFFWARAPADEPEARKAICELFATLEAREAPLSIGRLMKSAKGNDLIASLRIVWDEPGHLPPTPVMRVPIPDSGEL